MRDIVAWLTRINLESFAWVWLHRRGEARISARNSDIVLGRRMQKKLA